MTNIFQEQICGWPGFRLTFGDISLGVVPMIGGRILSLKFRGEELFFVSKELEGYRPDLSGEKDLRALKRRCGFHFWGGDKTWVAPEKDWWERMPPLDLDSGPYACEQAGDGLDLTSPVCRETGLQITRRIRLSDDGTISLQEEFLNTTKTLLRKGIWNVTQVLRTFDVWLPARVSDIRSYHIEDPTLPAHNIVPVEKEGWSCLPCRANICYKLGANVREGRAVLVKDTPSGRIIFERTFPIMPSAPYAHGSVVEVFNSFGYDYCELEIHSPLFDIQPGQRVSFQQEWRLRSGAAEDLFIPE